MKKYELVNQREDGLWQIKALKSFRDVKIGELGGWVESEQNLSHAGNAWVSGNARVSGNAKVSGNAWVSGNARVSDSAKVSGNAWVSGNARVSGNAWVFGDALVSGNARVSGDAWIIQNSDYTVFKNNLTSQRYYTYIFTNDFWVIGCFKGNTDELKKHLEKNGNELQKIEYNMAIEYVQKLKEIKEKMAVKR